jgi:hypothetical protein
MRFRLASVLLMGVVALVALGASLAAVETSPPAVSAVTASKLCHEGLGSKAPNAELTTVAEVRIRRVGTYPYPVAPHAFTPTNGSQLAAWCWTGRPGHYKLYAVAARYKPVYIESVNFPKTPPPGPAQTP